MIGNFEKHIVVTGNPVDGFTFYGTFRTANEAGDWAADELSKEEWWTASLTDPDQW